MDLGSVFLSPATPVRIGLPRRDLSLFPPLRAFGQGLPSYAQQASAMPGLPSTRRRVTFRVSLECVRAACRTGCMGAGCS